MGLQRLQWSAIPVYAIAVAVACAGMAGTSHAQYGPYMPGRPLFLAAPPTYGAQAYAPLLGGGYAAAPVTGIDQQRLASAASAQGNQWDGADGYDSAVPMPAGGASQKGVCQKGACQKCCATPCCCCEPCCLNWRFGAFVDGIYLRPRNVEVAYAVPVDGPVTPPPLQGVEVGRVARVDPDFETGFRAGFSVGLKDCSVFQLTYTKYENHTDDEITLDPSNVLLPLVIHPRATAVDVTSLDAAATLDVDFDLIDLDYRWQWVCCDEYYIAVIGGFRYGRLEQMFSSTYEVLGQLNVNTDVDFDGYGPRIGLETEKFVACSHFFVYGRGTTSFLAGDVKALYTERNQSDPEIVNAPWEAGRIVTVAELELGAGWQSPHGRLRASVGYMVSGWFNMVTTANFINAVQTNEFDGIGDKVTFDGATARVEFRY